MASYARKMVSGGKARFRDEELDVDLDLVYLTDRVIIMGYPASGFAAMYRNDREQARKFIEHRHGDKYWIFNFCPLTENAYDPAFFRGHVSRYPFPDHHAPPLALLALAVREMDAWISGDPDRVIVVHCKAGKGRSGTLACAYLLTLETPPQEPQLQRSFTAKEWTARRAAELIHHADDAAGTEEQGLEGAETRSLKPVREEEVPATGGTTNNAGGGRGGTSDVLAESVPRTDSPAGLAGDAPSKLTVRNALVPERRQASASSLETVLALHTTRRMRSGKPRPSRESGQQGGSKPKYGVSIASQRRFLGYWALLLTHSAPPSFWSLSPPAVRQHVLLHKITIDMRQPARPQRATVSLLNAALSRLSTQHQHDRGGGEVWVSLGRYDSAFEDALEQRERDTRDRNRGVGRADPAFGEEGLGIRHLLEQGSWDRQKMIRSFARLGESGAGSERDQITTHILHPLPPERWVRVRTPPHKPNERPPPASASKSSQEAQNQSTSDQMTDSSEEDAASTISNVSTPGPFHRSGAVMLEAGREVRVKLYIGQIPMGWFWFIPAFEMMQTDSTEPRVSRSSPAGREGSRHLRLARHELDFAHGAGAWIVDVELEMEWAPGRMDVGS